MKKKKKLIIIILIIIILIIALGNLFTYLKNKDKEYNSIDDFDSVKELVQYYGCKYIRTKNSSEEGFSKDIYISFMTNPIDEEGNTNQNSYENIIRLVSMKMQEDYRIIDEDRNLIVRIYMNYDEDETINYTINDINNYFEHLKSLYTLNNNKEDNISKINVTSKELQSIINNEWIRKNANLGQKTSSYEKYDVYWNNGYKVRTINNKIYNIVFIKNYQGEVFQGITVGMSNDEVRNILGNPTYENSSEMEVIGYKLENLYVFFSDGEISIYRIDEYNEEENKRFANLVTKLFEDKDYNTFLTNLTELYPDYSTYTQETNYVNIKYPLKGFEISFGNDEKNGITIYNNFIGNITNDISIDDIKNEKVLPANTYLNLETNLVFYDELERANGELFNREPLVTEDFEKGKFAQSDEYTVYFDEIYNVYTFYSIYKNNPDFELRVQNVTGIYKLTNNLFVYGVANDGLYVVDCYKMQSAKIINVDGECIIDRVENNTIYYDNTMVKVSTN